MARLSAMVLRVFRPPRDAVLAQITPHGTEDPARCGKPPRDQTRFEQPVSRFEMPPTAPCQRPHG